MDFSKLLEWLKLSPKYLFPISIVSGFVLFASVDILNIFGLTSLVSQIRPYLGVVFLLSTALLLTNCITMLYEWIQTKYRQAQNLRSMRKRLHSLTDDEKQILQSYIKSQTRTQYLPINDGVVNGLEIENIIFRASKVGQLRKWAYNIQPWAWEYLNNHPELLASNQDEQRRAKR